MSVWQSLWKQTITFHTGYNLNLIRRATLRTPWIQLLVDFKMDVVPEDAEYSQVHGKSFRDRTASLNSMPQTSASNWRHSRTLRLRSSVSSTKSVTCVCLKGFHVFLVIPFHLFVDLILNLPRSYRLSLAGICHILPRVSHGSRQVHSPMSIYKDALYHLFPLPRLHRPSSLRARPGD